MPDTTDTEARLLAELDRFDLVDLLRQLVRRRSDTSEADVAEYLQRRWQDRGIHTIVTEVEPGRCNVTAEAGDSGPSILLNSHMDTVPPGQRERWTADPFGGEVRNGRLYGRGAVDAKGCLAAMIAAFETLAATGVNGRLVLSAVSMEESGGMGTQREVGRGLRADAAIIGEPTNLQPNLGHRGAMRVEIEARGLPAHSAHPDSGINAIAAMAPVIIALEQLDRRLAGRLDAILHQRPCLTATVIQGGDAGNVVPARCSLLLDRRTLPTEREMDVAAEIEAAIIDATRESRAEVRLQPVRWTQGAVTDPSDAIAQTLCDAAATIRGQAPAPAGFFACCDMTFLSAIGIPTVIFGPGEERMCHVFDESMALDDLRHGAQVYALTAQRWLRN